MIIEQVVRALIDLAKGRIASRETSEKKAARALVRLHSALTDCHEAYETWRASSHNEQDHFGSTEHWAWQQSVCDLYSAFRKVKSELEIFAPEAYRSVRTYMATELLSDGLYGHLLPEITRVPERLDALIDQGHITPHMEFQEESELCSKEGSEKEDLQVKDSRLLPLRDITWKDLQHAVVADTSFEEAKELLRRFITESFKIEDLF